MDAAITEAARRAGLPYGITASDMLTYIATGDRQHGDAPANECGAVDPRDERAWCRLTPGHSGHHNRNRPLDGCGTWNECRAAGHMAAN